MQQQKERKKGLTANPSMATRPTKSSLALVNPIPPEVPKMPSSVFPPAAWKTRHHHISHPISPCIALGKLLTSIRSSRREEAKFSWQSSRRSAEIISTPPHHDSNFSLDALPTAMCDTFFLEQIFPKVASPYPSHIHIHIHTRPIMTP